MIDLLNLVLDTVSGLFAGVLLLRFWMQIVRIRPPQQVAQFTYQLSDWIVKPMRRIVPGVGGFDWASLIAAYLIALIFTGFEVWMAVDSVSVTLLVLAIFTLLGWAVYGWTGLLILEVIFSWVNPQAPMAPFVRALNAPLLNPLRRVIPLLGGLDISPMVLFLLLQAASKILHILAAMTPI